MDPIMIFPEYLDEVKMPPTGNCDVFRINRALIELRCGGEEIQLIAAPPEYSQWHQRPMEHKIKELTGRVDVELRKKSQLLELGPIEFMEEGTYEEPIMNTTIEDSRWLIQRCDHKERMESLDQIHSKWVLQSRHYDDEQKPTDKVGRLSLFSLNSSEQPLIKTFHQQEKQKRDSVQRLEEDCSKAFPQEISSQKKCTGTTKELKRTVDASKRKKEDEKFNRKCEVMNKTCGSLTASKQLMENKQKLIAQTRSRKMGSAESKHCEAVLDKQKELFPETLSPSESIQSQGSSAAQEVNASTMLKHKLESANENKEDPFSETADSVIQLRCNLRIENQSSKHCGVPEIACEVPITQGINSEGSPQEKASPQGIEAEENMVIENPSHVTIKEHKCVNMSNHSELDKNESVIHDTLSLSEVCDKLEGQKEEKEIASYGDNSAGSINTTEEANETRTLAENIEDESLYKTSEESHEWEVTDKNYFIEYEQGEMPSGKVEILSSTMTECGNPIAKACSEAEVHANQTEEGRMLGETNESVEPTDYVVVGSSDWSLEKPLHDGSLFLKRMKTLAASFVSTFRQGIQHEAVRSRDHNQQEINNSRSESKDCARGEEFLETSAGTSSACDFKDDEIPDKNVFSNDNKENVIVEKKVNNYTEMLNKTQAEETEMRINASSNIVHPATTANSNFHPKQEISNEGSSDGYCRSTIQTKEREDANAWVNGNEESNNGNQLDMQNRVTAEECVKSPTQLAYNAEHLDKPTTKLQLEDWSLLGGADASSRKLTKEINLGRNKGGQNKEPVKLNGKENVSSRKTRKTKRDQRNTNDDLTSLELFSALVDEMVPPVDSSNEINVLIVHTDHDAKFASELAEQLRKNFQIRATAACHLSALELMSPYSYINGAMHWADIVIPVISDRWLDEIKIISASSGSHRRSHIVRRFYMLIRNRVMNDLRVHWRVIPVVKGGTDPKYRLLPEFFNAIPVWVQFSKLVRSIKEMHKLSSLLR